MKAYAYALILLAFLLSPFAASAQGAIDNVMNSLEQKKDVETTYSERRNRKDHKICRITLILTFNKAEYYEKLEKAFESCREQTVSAVKNRDTRTFKFENKKGTSTYTLTRGNGGVYTAVKSWWSASDPGSDDMSEIHIPCDRPMSKAEIKKLRKSIEKQQRALARKQLAARD